jgi:hypothetical protein
VPEGSFAWNYIYGAAGAGVMPGCAPQTPTFTFCPAEVVTRRSMAGFIERAMHGALTPPPVYLVEFDDVLAGSFNANYIQGLVEDRVTAGCSVAPPLYCPDVPVTRAQMAVFVWKAVNGDVPPPSVHRRLRRRTVPRRVRGRLHRRHRRGGHHGRLRRRQLLPGCRRSRTHRWPCTWSRRSSLPYLP